MEVVGPAEAVGRVEAAEEAGAAEVVAPAARAEKEELAAAAGMGAVEETAVVAAVVLAELEETLPEMRLPVFGGYGIYGTSMR